MSFPVDARAQSAACGWKVEETALHLDQMIRPGLRRAFPLPAGGDLRFEQLLEALGSRASGPVAAPPGRGG